jgi:adenylate cyclase
LELGPDVAEVRSFYGYYFLRPLGRLAEATLEQKRAVDLDPLSAGALAYLAQFEYRQNRLEEAILLSNRALELDLANFLAHWTLGLVYSRQRDIEAAIQEVEQAVALSEQSAWILATLHNMYLRAGRVEEATAVMSGLEKRANECYIPPGSFAIMHFGLGNVELAMDWYEKAAEDRDPIALMLETEPGLGRLRSHPRYQMLRRKMGLEAQQAGPVELKRLG